MIGWTSLQWRSLPTINVPILQLRSPHFLPIFWSFDFAFSRNNHEDLIMLNADTMMKFASFEKTVELLYQNVVPIPKNECSKTTQLGVSFAGGYIAGVFCAVVSHPADNLVSFLNNSKGATVGDVSY